MKRYKLFSCQCGCGEVDWAESTNGEWVKYEDIINLLDNIKPPDYILPFDWECGWLNAIIQIKGELKK